MTKNPETRRSEGPRLIDDTGYLLPNVENHKVARDTSSSIFVRGEGDTGSVEIVHSYFGFRDGLEEGELKTPDGKSGAERQLDNEDAHSPPGATSNDDAGTLQIQHSYFGFRDAVGKEYTLGEDEDYQSEILFGNDGVKVQEKDGQTSSPSLMALQGKHNRMSTHHDNVSGCGKGEKEESCLSSLLLADRDTGYDEIIHSYFGFNDALEERHPKHEHTNCVEEQDEQGKISSSSSPCRKDRHGEIHPGSSDMGRYRLHESIDSHVSIPSFDGSHSPSFQHTYLDFNDLQEQQSKETLHNYEMVEERGKLGDGITRT